MDRKKELKLAYKQNPPKAGVYQIRNKVNGKVFIGSWPNVDGKLNSQRMMLQGNGHVSRELQADWNARKPEDFAFEVLEYMEPSDKSAAERADELSDLEKKWRDKLKPYGAAGYNTDKRGT